MDAGDAILVSPRATGTLRGSAVAGYFEEIRVFKAGISLNTLAWNNGRGRRASVGGTAVMVNRDSWGH